MNTNRKEQITRAFGRSAHIYNRNALLQQECAVKLCEYLPKKSPEKILEIGCGTGFLTKKLRQKYPEAKILCLDISRNMIASCQQNFLNDDLISFQVADGENVNFKEKFDLIVSSLTIQWFESPLSSTRALCQNLNEGGRFYFSTIGEDGFWQWKKTLKDLGLPSGFLKIPDYEGIFDEEKKITPYRNAQEFLRNLKKIGAHTPRAGYIPLAPQDLRKALSVFDETHNGSITWHILYGALDASGNAFRQAG